MNYRVMVSGSLWFESKDELVACRYASLVREQGWKDVKVEVLCMY